ncbi:Dcp1p-Dcp2p decapping enzyme complex alpha subunit, partial [Ascosphaera atra]
MDPNTSVPDLDQVGIKAGKDLADQFRHEVANLLDRRTLSFPGAQPVSFARHHLDELCRRDYFVVEKTDGIRCLLYFARGDAQQPEIHYLIDRKNDYRFVPGLHFPTPDDPTFQKFHVDTILDGELVYDRFDDGTKELKYLVFDCLVIDGLSLMHRTLDKRLAYFKEHILKPYNALFERFPEEKAHRPFTVADKSTQLSYGLPLMFGEIIPKVKRVHGNDGLIFTCRETPYRFGTDENIVKWKPPAENTIDFRMRLEFPMYDPRKNAGNHNANGGGEEEALEDREADRDPFVDYDAIPTAHLFIYTGNSSNNASGPNQPNYQWFSTLHLDPDDWASLKALNTPLDDTIVEAFLDEHKRWRMLRLRDDKDEANHVSTVEKVIVSIEDRVSQEDLIAAAPMIKSAWKKTTTTTVACCGEARQAVQNELISLGSALCQIALSYHPRAVTHHPDRSDSRRKFSASRRKVELRVN